MGQYGESDRIFHRSNIKVGLPLGFGVDGSVLYDQRSTKVTPDMYGGRIYTTTIEQQQVVIPINLRYDRSLTRMVGAFVFAGPQLGFNVGDKDIETCYADWEFKKATFSVNMGLGVTLFSHWQLSANYNLACTKSADLIINRYSAETRSNKGDGKFDSWQFSLGYFF